MNGIEVVGKFSFCQKGMNLSMTYTVQQLSFLPPFGLWSHVMRFDMLLWNFSFTKCTNLRCFGAAQTEGQQGFSFNLAHLTSLKRCRLWDKTA